MRKQVETTRVHGLPAHHMDAVSLFSMKGGGMADGKGQGAGPGVDSSSGGRDSGNMRVGEGGPDVGNIAPRVGLQLQA